MKKNQLKAFLSIFLTFLMIFSTINSSILGIKSVYAKGKEKNDSLIKGDITSLKVTNEKYNISINLKEKSLYIGQTCKCNAIVKDFNSSEINNPHIIWDSSDKSIATIDEEGNIKAIRDGKVIIKAILKDDVSYYGMKQLEILKDRKKAYLRVEGEIRRECNKEINVPEGGEKLEDVLKDANFEPEYDKEGIKITRLGLDRGKKYFSIIINEQLIKDYKHTIIKPGDKILCSFNGATNELQLEGVPNAFKSGKPFKVTVKDGQGKLVPGATIFLEDPIREEILQLGNTNENGESNVILEEVMDYYIFVQKDGYIRSVYHKVHTTLPKIEASFPKRVNNNEDFNINITVDGNPMPEIKVCWKWTSSSKSNIEMDKTDKHGRATGNIDAPAGKYSLIVNYHNNKVEIGHVEVLDKSKHKTIKVGSMNSAVSNATGIYLNEKIYLFGGEDNKDYSISNSIKSFDINTNEIKDIGTLPEKFIGNSVVVDNKIYLIGNEKIYEYDEKNNITTKIQDIPKGYISIGRGVATINKKIYIYVRKANEGAILEFNPITKSINITAQIKNLSEYTMDRFYSPIIGYANQKVYIIGEGEVFLEKCYEFNTIDKKINEFKIPKMRVSDSIPICIGGKIYIIAAEADKKLKELFTIGNYHIVEFDTKDKIFKNVSYIPEPNKCPNVVLARDNMYIFGSNYCEWEIMEYKIYNDIFKITGFSTEDTQKPEITVEGIENKSTVSIKKLPITVCVTDNKDEDIVPVIKCNDKELDSSILNKVDGKYNLTLDLKDGQNDIEVTATDKAGNIEVKRYKIICKENIVPNKIVIEGAKERLHPKDKLTLKTKILDKENNLIPGQEVIFSSSDEKIAKIDEKTGEVTAIGNGTVVLTSTLKHNKKVKESVKFTVTDKYKVFIRVEAYDHTILPRKEIEVGLFDLDPYLGKASGSSATKSDGWDIERFNGRPSNAHAIVKALTDAGFKQQKGKVNKDDKLFDFQDYGWSLYIAMIDGDREFKHGGMSGWLYRVNDVLPSVGCSDTPLNDGDEIVWMYSPYGFDNIYTKIFVDETDVSVNEQVNLKLTGYTGGYAHIDETVARATILVNGKPYNVNGKEVTTNSKGSATLTFDKPGDYTISATRQYNGGLIDIIRPNPIIIHVSDKKDSKKPRISVKGIVNGDTVNKSGVTFKVNAVDYKNEKLNPIVKCNDEVLKKENDNYSATLKEGKNIISILAEDKDKNVVEKTIEVICKTKDNALLEIKVEGIKSGITDKEKAVFTVEVNDENDGKISSMVKLNNKEIKPKEGKYEVLLKEGINVVTIEATNKNGNTAKEEFRINYVKKDSNNVSDNYYTKVMESLKKVNSFTKTNGTYSGDWRMVCLKGMGETIPDSYLADKEKVIKDYFENIAKTTKEKVTDYERMTIGIVAAGGDPTNIGGHNLIEKIYNFEGYKKDENSKPRGLDFQGLNGVIYGLIALDTNEYNVPKNAKYTREWMLDYILENINSDGGWDLTMNGRRSDVDITSMTLIALAPYHNYVSKSGKSVKKAVENAAKWLSEKQRKDGGYDSWGSKNNSESCAQTIIGLCVNGIDPTGAQFTKDINLVENLLKFQQTNGEFYHLMDGQKGVNGMATEQAFQALLAYKKFVDMASKYCNGKNSIYSFGKVYNTPDMELNKFDVKNVGQVNLEKGSNGEVKFSIKNNDNKDRKVTLLVVLYDKNTHEMKDYSYIKKVLKVGEKELLVSGLMIPNDGEYEAKAIVCDDLNIEKMNLLSIPIVYEVK